MSSVEREDDSVRVPESLSVLPLRDVVIFPGMITPLLVGRPRSLAALDEAMKGERLLLVLTQRQMNVDDPAPEDLYQVGTVVKILQLMRLVEGTIRILVEGVARGEVERFHKTRKYLRADVHLMSGAPLIKCTSARRYLRVLWKRSTSPRATPSTRIRMVPSTSRMSWRILTTVPTW